MSKVIWLYYLKCNKHTFLLQNSFCKLISLSLSLSAVNLINNLLQVVVRRRFSVGKAMGHPWFQVWGLVQTSKHIVLHSCHRMRSVIDAQLVCFSRCRTSRCGVTCASSSSGWDVVIWRTRRMTRAGEPTRWRKASLSLHIYQSRNNTHQTPRFYTNMTVNIVLYQKLCESAVLYI